MAISRKVLLLIAAATLATGLGLWLWPRPRLHVLLITLDTTRADRIGCYGYSSGRTPAVDSLASEGVLCESASTVAPLTLPAHASMFTGLYPAENGVRTNGRGRLDDSIPTLAEALRREGYDTAAFVAALVLDRKFGLDRGFNRYDDDFVGDEPDVDAMHRHRNGQAVVDAALAWLDKKRDSPFFCWVHLYDPHAPYLDHSDLFGTEFVERPYDAGIAYADRQIGRIVGYLRARGLESQTLVVVVGDHGEGLGEHSERTHGSTLYNTTMRVPLVFRQPGLLAPGRRIAADVSIADISPTILDLLRFRDGRKIAGQSVKPALLGRDMDPTPCYGSTDDPFLVNGWAPLRSLTVGTWKYIRTTRVELYDLAADPQELHNLAETRPEMTQLMESRLADLESRLVSRVEREVQLSAAERRALASLGYAGGAGPFPAGPPPASLPDVKDMLPFDIAAEEAVRLIQDGELDAAIARLKEIVRQAPTHTAASLFLGNALRKKKALEEAAAVFRSLIAVHPDCRDGHYGLGLVLLDQDRPGDAIPEFLRTLEADPQFAEAHFNLAMTFVNSGQLNEARTHFDSLLEVDPRHVSGYQWRAYLLASLGQNEAAVADYRKALRYAPGAAGIHHNLGVLLADLGDLEGAQTHLVRAVEINPRSAEFHNALGSLLLRQRQFDEAVTHLARAVELKPGYADAEARLQEARRAAQGGSSKSK